MPTKRQNIGSQAAPTSAQSACQGPAVSQPAAAAPASCHEKKPAKQADTAHKMSYVLTVLRDGEYKELTRAEMRQFVEEHPAIARFWQEPEALQGLAVPREDSVRAESWEQVARRIVSQLMRMHSAKIFNEPVDPEKLGVSDYFEVVKTPVDFGTIKQRLNTHHYHLAQEFVDDMLLVFDNCLLYNGDASATGRTCKKVRDEFKRLYEEFNIEFYLK